MTVAELRDELDKARAALLGYVESVDDADIHTNPDGHWSIAEHVDHLRISEELFARTLRRVIEKARSKRSIENGAPPLFEPNSEVIHAFDGGMSAIPPFRGTEPHTGIERAILLDGLGRSRVEMTSVVEEVSTSDFSGVTFRHPYLGHLSPYDWLIFVAVHERAHLAQMRMHREA
jgi:hypothetical protein